MFEDIKKLTQINAVSGNENEMAKYLMGVLTPICDKIYSDVMGNIVAVKKGLSEGKIALYAHIDEVGLVVSFVEKNGYLRVAPCGYIDPKTRANNTVTFENGIKGVFITPSVDEKIKIEDCYVDIGALSEKEACQKVSIGMNAAFDGEAVDLGDKIMSKALDDRIGCYILIEALKNAKVKNDTYFVFSTQEEVGLRGATTSTFEINPDVAIAIDVTSANQNPDKEDHLVKLGNGVAIKIRDKGMISSKKVVFDLESICEQNDIKYQRDVLISGTTDAAAAQVITGGALACGISVPTKYIHTSTEIISKYDVENAINLVIKYIEKGL